jgi:hypothetical protein
MRAIGQHQTYSTKKAAANELSKAAAVDPS